jgi:hypothetical protein
LEEALELLVVETELEVVLDDALDENVVGVDELEEVVVEEELVDVEGGVVEVVATVEEVEVEVVVEVEEGFAVAKYTPAAAIIIMITTITAMITVEMAVFLSGMGFKLERGHGPEYFN